MPSCCLSLPVLQRSAVVVPREDGRQRRVVSLQTFIFAATFQVRMGHPGWVLVMVPGGWEEAEGEEKKLHLYAVF